MSFLKKGRMLSSIEFPFFIADKSSVIFFLELFGAVGLVRMLFYLLYFDKFMHIIIYLFFDFWLYICILLLQINSKGILLSKSPE